MEAAALVLPIFLVIGAGVLSSRFGVLSEEAVDGVDKYAFNFALPALLFNALAHTELPTSLPWGLWLSYYGAVLLAWFLGAVLALVLLRRSAGDAVIIGFGGGFSNTVMLGIPIILVAYGEGADVPLFFILAFHGLLLFTIATFLLESTQRRGGAKLTPLQIVLDSLRQMFRNPVIVALGCGIIFGQTGLVIPVPVDTALEMLGRSGIPCALFALGAGLTRYELKKSIGAASLMTCVKLIIHPVLVFLLASYVFKLPPLWLKVATTMAAMPTGVFTFVLANRYGAAPGAASSAIVLATAFSMISITVVLNIFL